MTSIGIRGIPRKYGFFSLRGSWVFWFVLLSCCYFGVYSLLAANKQVGEGGESAPKSQVEGSADENRTATPTPASLQKQEEGEKETKERRTGPAVSSGALVGGSSDLDPEVVIRRAIWQAVWGEPVSARVRQRIAMYGRELVGVGSYHHAGEGSAKVKWQMRLAAGDAVTNFLQISDGRLLWTSQQVNETIELSRLDLGRIREQIGPVRQSDLSNPLLAMELAIGGQAELLRNVYHRYRWDSAIPTKIDQYPVWILSGEIRQTAPIPSARAPIDQAMLQPSVSGLLPQRVRLAIGRTEQFPFFPHRIEYFRQKVEKNQVTWEMVNSVEFFEVSKPKELGAEIFQYEVRDSVELIQDDTVKYLPSSPLHLTRQPVLPVQR